MRVRVVCECGCAFLVRRSCVTTRRFSLSLSLERERERLDFPCPHCSPPPRVCVQRSHAQANLDAAAAELGGADLSGTHNHMCMAHGGGSGTAGELGLAARPPVACGACGAPCAARFCGRCKEVAYCGPDCQRAHWRGEHKLVCVNAVERIAMNKGSGGGGGSATPIAHAVGTFARVYVCVVGGVCVRCLCF